jgi:hypothetical protein
MDQTVHGAKGVMLISQAPPLAVIPRIENDQDQRRHITKRILLFLVVVVVAAACIGVIHFFFKPLIPL